MRALELVQLHTSGQFDRTELLVRLANLTYATGEFDARTPYVPGQTEELQLLVETGQLTEAEREQIIRTVYAFEKKHDTDPLDHLV